MLSNKLYLTDLIKSMSDEDYASFVDSLSNNPIISKYTGTQIDSLYSKSEKITAFLDSFGFNVNREGYQYMRTGIGILLYEPQVVGKKITTLYHELAKRYGSTYSGIERGIRYSLERRYEEDFHVFDCFGHAWDFPKNKEFFKYALEKLS